jgi:hypothetical protein
MGDGWWAREVRMCRCPAHIHAPTNCKFYTYASPVQLAHLASGLGESFAICVTRCGIRLEKKIAQYMESRGQGQPATPTSPATPRTSSNRRRSIARRNTLMAPPPDLSGFRRMQVLYHRLY